MKSLLALVGLIVICGIVFIGGRVLFTGSPTKHMNAPKKARGVKTQVSVSSTALPSPPLSCRTSVSLIPLSADYSITGMGCVSPASSGTVLDCNGAILQHATNVSIDCTTPNAIKRVVCSGAANTASSPGNLAVNYSCHTPTTLSSDVIYSCAGDIAGYSSLGINLPLSVSCSG